MSSYRVSTLLFVAMVGVALFTNRIVLADEPSTAAPVTAKNTAFVTVRPTPTRPGTGIIGREIERQAFLLAAREELGLPTRDPMLEPGAVDDDEQPGFQFRNEARVFELRWGTKAASERLLRQGIARAPDGFTNYATLLERAELLSREEFIAELKKKGFEGSPRPWTSEPAPDEVLKLLDEMKFTSQFQAVRTLHQLIKQQGDSPALLAALVRGYANLGLLTEHLWHPAHKVFKARALLYAQRLVARPDVDRVLAYSHRAYAWGLSSFLEWSLKDIEAVDQALKDSNAPASSAPAWLETVRLYCNFDGDALGKIPSAEPHGPLARLLRVMAVAQAGSPDYTVEVTLEEGRGLPECYRLGDLLCEPGSGISVLHEATLVGFGQCAMTLYDRVAAMPGAPEGVLAIAKEGVAAAGSERDPREREFARRARLTKALCETKSDDNEEFSWRTLGLLSRELAFIQAWRRLDFEQNAWGVSPDEFLALARPLVAEHPLRNFIETYTWNSEARKAAIATFHGQLSGEWPEVDRYQDLKILFPDDEKALREHWRAATWNVDYNAYDMRRLTRNHLERLDWAKKTLVRYGNSPFARATIAELDWEHAKEQAAQWEQESAQHPAVLTAIGRGYAREKHLDEAQRCYRLALQRDHSLKLNFALADTFLLEEDHEQYLATLKECLKLPDHGLSHTNVRIRIASFYAYQGQWEKAAPLVDEAAQSGSGYSYIAATETHEALQDWESAESYCRADAERYQNSKLRWYFFCKRTGQGDLEAARQFAQAAIDEDAGKFESVSYDDMRLMWQIDKNWPKLVELAAKGFGSNFNPSDGLLWAMAADELKDDKQRDEALRLVREKGDQFIQPNYKNQPRAALIGLAGLMADDLSKGGKGEFDANAIEKLRGAATWYDQTVFSYYFAWYLSRHGKGGQAVEEWKRCMPMQGEITNAFAWYRGIRTLAGVALWDCGVSPAQYKEVVQSNPDFEYRKKKSSE